jgi:hypothetical protein
MNQVVSNPWLVQEAKKYVEVPPGMYLAEFAGVENKTLQDGSLRWRWAWRITTGPLAGQYATALTHQNISPATHAGRLIEGLLGGPLKPGDDVKALVDACVGKPYLVSIQKGPKGGKAAVQTVGQPPQM